jgi:AraC-like DNA-binding protein
VPNARVVGLRFFPAGAPSFLGVPASAIVDCHVAARDVLGARATPLIDALHGAKTAREAANILLAQTSQWLRAEPDRLVEKTIHDVRASAHDIRVAELANTIGVSERQLRRRFVDAVGYAPKTFQRITRLRRFVASSAGPRRPLVELAIECGYADQAHLTREVRALTGLTPASLVGYPVTLG